MSMIDEYYKALDRLIQNKPINVPIGTKINNDTVALEAGRKRGSIKKSREIFLDLIDKIDKVSKEKTFLEKEQKLKIEKLKNKANDYRILYEEVLNRELMLIERVKFLESELEKFKSKKLHVANNVL
ncbi:hypothetical protein [Aliarcobacter cryaerophilus]|uniref:hypothetical protein n=1 Tax=Aliarcobacter cryaerophilus TaxID=28198 RepID=UPI00082A8E86|nr:hypothetical protein [Aliarcobacter cryaerophilus]